MSFLNLLFLIPLMMLLIILPLLDQLTTGTPLTGCQAQGCPTVKKCRTSGHLPTATQLVWTLLWEDPHMSWSQITTWEVMMLIVTTPLHMKKSSLVKTSSHPRCLEVRTALNHTHHCSPACPFLRSPSWTQAVRGIKTQGLISTPANICPPTSYPLGMYPWETSVHQWISQLQSMGTLRSH